jgi:ankyrin repeat protein
VVKLLLDFGADINAQEGMQSTPFDIAMNADNLPLAELLLSAGAMVSEEVLAEFKRKVVALREGKPGDPE